MKKNKILIILLIVAVIVIGFSMIVYFDMYDDMVWLSFTIWLAGTLLLLYRIGRSVKRTMPQIKNYGADEVFSSVGTIGVILAIVLAPVMTSGFGSFRIWDVLYGDSRGAQPIEFAAYYVLTSVAVSLGMALIFAFVGAIVIALPMAFIGHVIFRSSNMPSIAGDVGVESALFALGFILLSQFCGAIDYFAFGDALLRNLRALG